PLATQARQRKRACRFDPHGAQRGVHVRAGGHASVVRLDPTTQRRTAPADMYVVELRLPGGNKLQAGEICPKHAGGNLWLQMNARLALTLAASFLFAGVFIGAFGAHVLEGKLAPDLMIAYQTAVQYHFWHALGLLGVAILLFHKPDYAPLVLSAWFMVV